MYYLHVLQSRNKLIFRP